MTNRTDHGMRMTADTPRKARQVALAASVALFAVTGTATIAWSALTVAFGPEEKAAVASSGPEITPRAEAEQFAKHTRLQSAATPDMTPEARPAPVVLAQADTSDTRSATPAHRGAAALEAAVQPKPFSATRPAAAPADPRPVARPAPDAMALQDTPSATPDANVAASAAPVAARPAPAPAPEPARTVARTEETASDRGSLLHRLWSVGMYR